MKLKKKKNLSPEANELRRLVNLGTNKKLWTGVEDCGPTVGIKAGTIADHVQRPIRGEKVLLSVLKVAAYLKRKKVRFHSEFVSDQQLETPMEQAGSPPETTGPPEARTFNAIDRLATAMEKVVERIEHVAVPQGIVTGTLFTEVLAGTLEFADQAMNSVRFVLKEGTFRKLDGEVTDREIEDTRLLIVELRRRLVLFSQLMSPKHKELRGKMFRVLSSEIDHLYIATKQLEEVLPTGASAHLLELERARKMRTER